MASPRKTLGVPETATVAECAEAYRRLAKEHHPDRGGDPARFQEIAEAWKAIRAGAPRSLVRTTVDRDMMAAFLRQHQGACPDWFADALKKGRGK